jgi:hypothetical protein
MPPDDGVIEVPIGSPGTSPGDGSIPIGDDEMADVPANIHEQHLSRIGATGVLASDHNQQFNKILDLNYEADRKIVSLRESLGVREVTSQSGQTGIPLAGGQAGK